VGDARAPHVAHVFGENQRVEQFIRAIRDGDLAKAGEWMNMSHTSLKMLYRVSCDELDRLVEIAQATPGVYGARMTGGGFGGCIVALVAPEAVPELAANIERNYRTPAGKAPAVFSSAAAGGAGAIELT
jgi:galactokinase